MSRHARYTFENKAVLCWSCLYEGRHDVGHFVIATGRGVHRLSSSISEGVWTHAEKQLKSAFISPPIEVGDYCS